MPGEDRKRQLERDAARGRRDHAPRERLLRGRPIPPQSRFEDGEGTNPEELIAAAHAGCFSMALSGNLSRAGFDADERGHRGEGHDRARR